MEGGNSITCHVNEVGSYKYIRINNHGGTVSDSMQRVVSNDRMYVCTDP